jgi:hypothetical protein
MTTKRFIAGAVCPRCGAMDRLVSYDNEEGRFKECVACDFLEKQVAAVQVDELDTRVNQYEDDQVETEVTLVKIIEPPKP